MTLQASEILGLVSQQLSLGNLHEAKSHVLFARSVWPNDYNIWFAHFDVLMAEKNFKLASNILVELFLKQDSSLLPELVKRIIKLATSHLESAPLPLSGDQREIDITQYIDKQNLQNILIKCVNYLQNVDTKTSLVVYSLYLKWYPQDIQHLVDCTTLLLKFTPEPTVQNPYMNFLVNHCVEGVMTYVTSHEESGIHTKLDLDLLIQMTVKYYLFNFQWKKLYWLLRLHQQHLNVLAPGTKLEVIPSIQSDQDGLSTSDRQKMIQIVSQFTDSSNPQKTKLCTYILMSIFYHTLYEYYLELVREGSLKFALFLNADYAQSEAASNHPKKRKLDSISQDETNKRYFQLLEMCSSCCLFENTELVAKPTTVQQYFLNLTKSWNLNALDWVQLCLGDMLFSNKQYKTATAHYTQLREHIEAVLHGRKTKSDEEPNPGNVLLSRDLKTKYAIEILDLRLQLMLGCCSLLLEELVAARHTFLSVLRKLPFSNQQTKDRELSSSGFCNFKKLNDNILIFETIANLITLYEILGNDSGTLVLIQFAWPYYAPKFRDIVQRITEKGILFETFFDYIINTDMLEEFAFLVEQSNQLVLLPGSHVLRPSKEDLHQMMEQQMVSSCSPEMSTSNVLARFFANEAKL